MLEDPATQGHAYRKREKNKRGERTEGQNKIEREKEGRREAKIDSFKGELGRTLRAFPKEGRMIREKH